MKGFVTDRRPRPNLPIINLSRMKSHAARFGRFTCWLATLLLTLLVLAPVLQASDSPAASTAGASTVTFVFTSDLHYGLNRYYFRGGANVPAPIVNAALARKINTLPSTSLPGDGGLRAGQIIGPIDFIVVTGDLANRQDLYPIHIQSAAASWAQFEESFAQVLSVKDAAGRPAPLLLVPGNHDVSDAIGSPSKMLPARDASSMVGIYNRMMQPGTPRTKESYRYDTDRIQCSRDIGGAHLVFITMWPDSVARAWIEQDLAKVPPTTPVFLFCHDQPDIDAKHLTNPNGKHDINSHDKFENLVADQCADGGTTEAPTLIEQRALAAFLQAHRNIVGYFHGNANWNEFYTWKGPDSNLSLSVFRADSPIKGRDSGKKESKLSFQVVTYDAAAGKLTARECLWHINGTKDTDATPVKWGETRTISIIPRP